MISDVFGWNLINARLIADQYAEEAGLVVYLPHFFIESGPAPLNYMTDPSVQFNRMNKLPLIVFVANVVREKHQKVATIGYCWGTFGVFALGSKKYGLVDACAICHPTVIPLFTPHWPQDIEELDKLILFLLAGNEEIFTPDKVAQTKESLDKKGADYTIIEFPGVEHGFSLRGNEKNETEKAATIKSKTMLSHGSSVT
ncbi:hypothetical protein BZG36_05261 [Bifiguratus adelaidae]|uniref:Dienelactone hydrolase domain-containing protein n=1 Tax=Bifiguratus adelaidae TaxID=1938954 RepID=A0A261XU66_9FUNG|nr:hypothetical protein BZG36_05261 [Bifiguratus adelaidae]